jgi:hypothetical protein
MKPPPVKKPLFHNHCTTCQARIAVLRSEAIGQILECPKCGSMVQIVSPKGWTAPEAELTLTGATTSSLQSGPPPLDKVGETFLALDVEEQVAKLSPWRRLLTVFKVRIVWFIGAVGLGVMVLTVWAIWAATLAQENTELAEKNPTEGIQSDQPRQGDGSSALSFGKPAEATPSAADGDHGSHSPPAARSALGVEPPVKEESSKPPISLAQEPEQNQASPPQNRLKGDSPIFVDTKIGTVPQSEQKTGSAPRGDSQPAGEGAVKKEQGPPPAETPASGLAAAAPTTSETSAARLVKMVAPEMVDVEKRLGMVLPDVELQHMALVQALALVSALGNVPLTIDPDALCLTGVSPRDPVSVNFQEASLKRLLEAIVIKRGLSVDVGAGEVLITLSREEREKLRPVRYKVDDLCPDQSDLEALGALVRELIAPASWQDRGGEASMQAENGALLVTQCGAVHREILVFCEKLRRARGLPLRSGLPPSQFVLTSRYTRAKPRLERTVSANFHEPAPLVQILGELAAQTDVDILVDRRALAAEEMSDRMEVAYVVDGKTLESALKELLPPLKLDFRPIDATTLQVTTSVAMQACQEIEFYPVGKLLGGGRTASGLIEQIKTAVAPASWQDEDNPGAIHFDRASQTLIVAQSPPVQAAVERFLVPKPLSPSGRGSE